jgi:hypothetical protein
MASENTSAVSTKRNLIIAIVAGAITITAIVVAFASEYFELPFEVATSPRRTAAGRGTGRAGGARTPRIGRIFPFVSSAIQFASSRKSWLLWGQMEHSTCPARSASLSVESRDLSFIWSVLLVRMRVRIRVNDRLLSQFVRVRHTPSKKIGQRRADIIKELLACIGVALLQPRHEVRASAASLDALCVIQCFPSFDGS